MRHFPRKLSPSSTAYGALDTESPCPGCPLRTPWVLISTGAHKLVLVFQERKASSYVLDLIYSMIRWAWHGLEGYIWYGHPCDQHTQLKPNAGQGLCSAVHSSTCTSMYIVSLGFPLVFCQETLPLPNTLRNHRLFWSRLLLYLLLCHQTAAWQACCMIYTYTHMYTHQHTPQPTLTARDNTYCACEDSKDVAFAISVGGNWTKIKGTGQCWDTWVHSSKP